MSDERGRDPLMPLVGAGVCFLLDRILSYFLVPVGDAMGGRMIALTVPPLVAAAVSAALALAIFESRRLGDIGLAWVDGTFRNFITGICLGVIAASLSVLPAVALGFAHFQRSPNVDISAGGSLFTPILLFCGSLGEEIAFRGFSFQYLVRGYGRWIAILATAGLFGLLHAGNPDATTLSTINTVGFGIVFAVAVLRSRDLWLPAGIHLAWNTVLPFLGVGLSGLTIKVTAYEVVWNGGNFWSGGQYGPEASGVTSVIIVLLLAAIWKVPVTPGSAYLVAESQASPSAS